MWSIYQLDTLYTTEKMSMCDAGSGSNSLLCIGTTGFCRSRYGIRLSCVLHCILRTTVFWRLCCTLQYTIKYCNTMQHTATHCRIPQHTTTYCNILQHTATHCNTLQHTCTRHQPAEGFVSMLTTMWSSSYTAMRSTHCSTLQHTAIHCNILQHTATYCSIQATAIHCSILQHAATH